jgi:hypothetical protein
MNKDLYELKPIEMTFAAIDKRAAEAIKEIEKSVIEQKAAVIRQYHARGIYA